MPSQLIISGEISMRDYLIIISDWCLRADQCSILRAEDGSLNIFVSEEYSDESDNTNFVRDYLMENKIEFYVKTKDSFGFYNKMLFGQHNVCYLEDINKVDIEATLTEAAIIETLPLEELTLYMEKKGAIGDYVRAKLRGDEVPSSILQYLVKEEAKKHIKTTFDPFSIKGLSDEETREVIQHSNMDPKNLVDKVKQLIYTAGLDDSEIEEALNYDISEEH